MVGKVRLLSFRGTAQLFAARDLIVSCKLGVLWNVSSKNNNHGRALSLAALHPRDCKGGGSAGQGQEAADLPFFLVIDDRW